ncbi:phage tail tube protein [Leifsonia xyli]|nr:phage tail tube protein [Leifsonia xyli]
MMSTGTGLAGQVGIAPEGTYGTFQTPTRFLPISKAQLTKVKNTIGQSWLGAGRLMDLGAGRVVTTRGGKGTFDLDVTNRGMGLLLQALMGTTVTPIQVGSTAAYTQTHALADTVDKSLTVQAGIPDATGTVRPYTFLGAKVTDATFTFEPGKEVTSTFTLDTQDVIESQTLAAASYVTTMRPFVGTDTSVKVGMFGSEVAVSGVKKVTIKIERPQNAARYYLGGQGLKAQPLLNAMTKITGTIEADFIDKTIWADRFASDAPFSLVLEADGLQIGASGNFDTFRITLPQCFLDGDTPTLQGPDVVSGSFPFTALFDGANLPTIFTQSADTTL